jgi:molybdenum cofactor cytidylyltransferase
VDVVAILLAAGESERMGRPKALLPWHGQPLLTHQLRQVQKSRVAECVVVLGPDADRLEPLIRPHGLFRGFKARPVFNPRHREGKSSSILAGLRSLPAPPDGILVAAVDQPLDSRLIDALIALAEGEWDRCEAAGRRTILVPAFRGRPGHPPLFCKTLFGELMGICEESQGLKAIVRREPSRVRLLPWEDPGVLLNLNAPVDLPAPAAGGLRR